MIKKKIIKKEYVAPYKIDKSKPVKVDLGSGLNYYKGINNDEIGQWIHIDGDPAPHVEIVCDWVNIPIESGVVDELHSSETVEHIPPWDHEKTFTEWNRVLKIGGVFFGTTPNFNWSATQYAMGKMDYDTAQANLYGDRAGYHHVHYQTYTKETLTLLLEKYGFGEIDFSGSPGLPNTAWWLVFTCKKIKNA